MKKIIKGCYKIYKMPKATIFLRLQWLCLCLFIMASKVVAQSAQYDVLPLNAVYSFNYNQNPDNLVPVHPSMTGLSYQWQQTSTPFGTFTNVSGATAATLSFSSPLVQTTYFRRVTNLSGGTTIYSNTIKLEVVSVNWEDLSYVREHTVLVAGLTDWKLVDQLPTGSKMQTTNYVDGLGRSVQQVSKETATPAAGSSTWGDQVKFSVYDIFNRQPKDYLSYTSTATPGKYKTDDLNQQQLYYSTSYGETNPYTLNNFDFSPLNRVMTSNTPGTSTSTSVNAYELNALSDDVKIFTVGYNSGDVPVLSGSYAAKTLYRIKGVDVTGKQSIQFVNKNGQVVLSKTQIADNPGASTDGWICVYNVYDDFGLLRYRFQPEAVKWLSTHSYSFSGTDGQTVLKEQCFRYEYDSKNRLILKKAPGAEPLYLIYDQRDRVVFAQDGNQRAKSPAEWTVTLYDEIDRSILSLLYRTSKSVAQLQTDIDNAAERTTVTATTAGQAIVDLLVDNRQAGISSYKAQNSVELTAGFESLTSDEFTIEIDPSAVSPASTVNTTIYRNPISSTDLNNPTISAILKNNFYDDYTFPGSKPFNTLFDNLVAYPTGGDAIAATQRTLSIPTGASFRVLGTNIFLSTTTYYDENGRPLQSLTDNIKNGIDISTVQYQFDGRVLSRNTKHSTVGTGYTSFSTITKYSFDLIGRITGVEKKFGANAFKAVATYAYDEMGRFKKKRLSPGYTATGKNELESLDYSYNIHGEITGINKDYALKTPGKYDKWGNFFGLYLGYDNRDGVFTNAQIDGHVTGLLWNTQGDDAQRKYDFSYDNFGRLINAQFKQRQSPGDAWANTNMDFSISGTGGKIGYDLNGNLLSMIQKGVLPGNATPINIDDLQYTYVGFSNKLLKVIDNGTAGASNGKLGDFTDGTNGTANDYVYDDNGNVVIDLNKNAKELNNVVNAPGIRYNFMDKPEEIRIAGKGVIRIVYDAYGSKLQRTYTPESTGITLVTTYINGFVYQGNDLQYINFEEGSIRARSLVNETNGYDNLSIDGNMDLPGGKRGSYDYFIRDYQQNVRMIVTEETHSGSNIATLETFRDENEATLFGQIDAAGQPTANNEIRARFAISGIPGQGGGGGWTNSSIGSYVSKLSALAGRKTGPNTLLKVMAGDKLSATTIYYYQNPVVNTTGTSVLTDLLGSLYGAISAGGATSGLMHNGTTATNINNQLTVSTPFATATSPHANSTTGNAPKAYLMILFFDERFQFISDGSTYTRVSQAGNGAAPLDLVNIKAPKNGYVYIYVSNESNEPVYFDNLQVTHERGRIIEEDHYYAYGLRIAGISSHKLGGAESLNNHYLYNDKELFEDADLSWYDYGFRMYDPQTGRFIQLDPLTDSYPYLAPYQYASCDPILNIDLDGLEGVSSTVPAAVTKAANRLAADGATIISKRLVMTGNHAGRWVINFFQDGICRNHFVSTITFELLLGPAVKNAFAVIKAQGSLNTYKQIPWQAQSQYFNSSETTNQTANRGIKVTPEKISTTIGFTSLAADIYTNTTWKGAYMYKNSAGELRSVFDTKYGLGRSPGNLGNVARYSQNARGAINSTRLLRGASSFLFVGGIALDGYSAIEAIVTNDPNKSNIIAKSSVNTGVAIYGVVASGGWVAAGGYFLIDALYPGGFGAAMDKNASLLEQNRRLMKNPNWHLHRD